MAWLTHPLAKMRGAGEHGAGGHAPRLMVFGLVLFLLSQPVFVLLGSSQAWAATPCPRYQSFCLTGGGKLTLDMRTGETVISGGVQGHIREKELRFWSDSLRGYQDDRQIWQRIVLKGHVRLEEGGRTLNADEADLTDDLVRLKGAVEIVDTTDGRTLNADEVDLTDGQAHMKGAVEITDSREGRTLNADEVDLTDGQAHMKGAVEIADTREGRTLNADEVEVSEDQLRLTGSVRGVFPKEDREFSADQALVREGFVHLQGAVEVRDSRATFWADDAVLDEQQDKLLLNGQPDEPVQILVRQHGQNDGVADGVVDGASDGAADGPSSGETQSDGHEPQETHTPRKPREPQQDIRLRADKVLVEEGGSHFDLSGGVRLEQGDEEWLLTADSAVLDVDEDGELTRFRAEGDVYMRQPGRELRADAVYTSESLDKIVLDGNAKVGQKGVFDLTGDRLEVYRDMERGTVRGGEEEQPVTLNLQIGKKAEFVLDDAVFTRLSNAKVPVGVLTSLAPLHNRRTTGEDAFRTEISKLITPDEVKRHGDLIVEQARR